ncbi:MAG: 50S ribosomal protein L21 [Erythrobacter sp.]|jgi:large subunit ribosomal protein L21|nr:50S ribosomal protein L21 [Erythrobacter sp.]
MFAIVRTGGKQYRVAAGDKIAVEKLSGEAGDTVTLGDVLLAGEGEEIADAAKITVSAEIIAQAKSEKVVVFKKKRRHNYRRKAGHRQQMTLLRITDVGEGGAKKAPAKTASVKQADEAPATGTHGNGSTGEQTADKASDHNAPAQKAASKGAAAEAKATTEETKKTAPKKAPAKKAAPKGDEK